MELNIETKKSGQTVIISLSGQINSATADKLAVEIEILSNDVKELILEMEKVQYVSSAGLRQLIIAQKKMKALCGILMIKNVQEPVYEILQMTGLSNVLQLTQA